MSDVLTFIQRPDGTIVAQTAQATTDVQTVTPAGAIVVATPATLVTRQALSFLRANPDGSISQVLFDVQGNGNTVTAQLKLGQRFVLHLMTPKGSILYRAKQGCNFVNQLRQGRAFTERDVFGAFAASMADVRSNMQGEEASTDPPAERFSRARITQIKVSRGSAIMTVAVQSLASEVLKVNMPLDFKT